MKNVTITLPEDVARWARVRAAYHGTSLSRMVGELLSERMAEEQGYGSAMEQYLGQSPTELKTAASYPSREELHERDGFR